mgnify:CR=1 FL=1
MDVVPIQTDVGKGYLKGISEREGGGRPLASEWVVTQLAARMDIPTLRFGLYRVKSGQIPLENGFVAEGQPL